MTQLQKNNTNVTEPIPCPHSSTDQPQDPQNILFQNHNLSDSEIQQNKAIVEAIFQPQKNISNQQSPQLHEEPEDQDIKKFLEEQIPGLYNSKETDQYSYKEEQDHIYSNYNNSIGPQYFTMSKYQKQNYFDNLNAVYMSRMKCQNKTQKLTSKSDTQNTQNQTQLTNNQKPPKKNKPAIKFNQIIFEVPFNKEDQPIIVKDTPQQQGFIVFDDEAYDGSYSQQDSHELQQSQSQQDRQDLLNMSNSYFDDFQTDQFQNTFKQKLISTISQNHQELFFDMRKNKYFLGQNQNSDSLGQSQQSYQNQNYVIKNSSSSTISSSDEQQKIIISKYKRGYNRKFLSSSSSQSSQQEDQQHGQGQQQDKIYFTQSQEQQEQDAEEQEQQFRQNRKGRKIVNPISCNNSYGKDINETAIKVEMPCTGNIILENGDKN